MDAGRKVSNQRNAGTPVDWTRKRFLVIDDFSDMRSMLRSMLESYGAQHIDQAANGEDAVRLMERSGRTPYDVILCDYNLGAGQDGQQVLEEAKYKGLLRFSTVFIMITAENTVRMVMGAVEYQPDDYLSKPFNKFQLKNRLDRLIVRKADLAPIDAAIESNQPARAVALCDERLAGEPNNAAELLKLKAGLLFDLGRLDEAEKIYREILSSRNAPWAKIALGKIRFHSGEYGAARDLFQEVIDDNSQNMEAHDWLAKALTELDELDRAEQVLLSAVEMSPKAIQRQMALGDLALKRGSFEVAGRAFRKAVVLGKNSVYRTPSNYVKQARALSHTSGKEALRALRALRQEFRGDKQAVLQAAAMESAVYHGMGMSQDAEESYRQATALYDKLGGSVSSEAATEMARAAFANGDNEKAIGLIEQIVANNHDDSALLDEVQQVFSDAGLEDEGSRIIDQAREQVAQLNNKGVRLAEEGNLDEAVRLFEQALKDMPENRTINMNVVKVLLLQLKKAGRDDDRLAQARHYFERLRDLDPENPGLPQLAALYEQVTASEE